MSAIDTLCLLPKGNIFLRAAQQQTADAFTGCPWRHEVVLRAETHTAQEVRDVLQSAILADTREPLLLVWSGHGTDGFWVWEYAKERTRAFAYAHLVSLLAEGTRPVFIINDACGGGELGELVEHSPELSQRVAVLSASSKGGTADAGFLTRQFYESMHARKIFEPADEYCAWSIWRPLRAVPVLPIPARVRYWLRNICRAAHRLPTLPAKATICLKSGPYDAATITFPNAPVRHGTRALDGVIFSGLQ